MTFVQVAPPTGKLFTAASVGTTSFYGAVAGGQVWNWNSRTGAWEALPDFGSAGAHLPTSVTYSAGGDLWAVDEQARVSSFVPPTWRCCANVLMKQISVGSSANVWGVNGSGNVYKSTTTGNGWTLMPGILGSVSVASDGTVWGLGPNDAIWRWSGTTWVAFPGALHWISVGSAANVWGVNAAGQVFNLNAASTGWDVPVVPSGAFVGVSAASDGTVLLVRQDGTLWKGTTTSASAPTPTPAPVTGWTSTSYQATEIAVGKNGAVWFINGGAIYQVTASGPQAVTGAATNIAVDPNGVPWVVASNHNIYKWNGSGWTMMTGLANDIGIGANGAVWIIGTDSVPASWNGSAWVKISGAATRISVDASGTPWVVNSAGSIYKWTGSAWQQLPGAATDISVGPDGTVYVVASGNIFRWGGTSWILETGVAGTTVAAGSGLHAWVARSGQAVLTR